MLKAKKKKTRKLVRPDLLEANQQFALMVEFMDNNGSRELRCERPKTDFILFS